MEKVIFGAYPRDWDTFDLVLGLTADLLPVVSDPNATKSPLSKIQGPGKTPSYFNGRGQMVGLPEWTKYAATFDDVAKWSKNDRLGICLQTRQARAIDVDVGDFDEATDVEAFIDAHLGFKLPVRRRKNSTKFLMLFWLPGDMTKRRFKTKTEGNFIELLATGQQCVVAGQHTSGARYEWDGGPPEDIPPLTSEQFEALWLALHAKFGSEASVTVRNGQAPTVKRRLEDANDPIGFFLEEHWTVHNVTDDGRVDILCPWHEGHSTESGETATSWYLAGVGGFAQGHFKCLHTSCAGRTDQDFKNAIGYNSHDFEVIEVPDGDVRPARQPQETGTAVDNYLDLPKAIRDNLRPPKKDQKNPVAVIPVANAVFAALDHAHFCGHGILYDRFRDEIMITNNVIDRPLHMLPITELDWRTLRDDDYFMLKMRLERGASFGHKFEPIAIDMVRQAVRHVAQHRSYDSLTTLVESYQWDGVCRIDTFLRDFMGAEDSPYTRAVSRYYWSALAGRALVPGVKADMVPIAVGKQGGRKTTLIRTIAPHSDMFVELDLSKNDADLARDMRGKIVGELGEMKGFSARMIEHIKSFITREREEWTPKYLEYTTKYLRRCIFFGTTNDGEPLPPDSTGNRRFLPFIVRDGVLCSVAELVAVREQLWAEAAVLFKANGVAWQDAERLAPHEHPQFEKEDSWVEHLREYLFGSEMGEPAPIDNPDGLKLINVITSGLSIPVKEVTRSIEIRVADCLRVIGLKKATRKYGKVWVRP